MAELAVAGISWPQKYEPLIRPWHPQAFFWVQCRLPCQPLFSRVVYWFRINKQSSFAQRLVNICCVWSSQVSVPIQDQALPLCVRRGTEHFQGSAERVCCGHRITPKLPFVLSSGSSTTGTMSGVLRVWGMGWVRDPSLSVLISSPQKHPNFTSWDDTLPCLENKCTAECEGLGVCGERSMQEPPLRGYV